MTRRLAAAFLLVGLAGLPLSANWPQWRGPTLNGVSGETNLPTRWSPSENIAWKTALPAWSGATPIVWNDHVFLNVAVDDQLALWALDRNTGHVLWRAALGAGNVKLRKQNMSSPSPVTDGRRVFVLTGTGVLKGFDFSGKELWGRDLQKEYGPFGLNWGYASSPLLHDNALFVQVLHGMKTDDPSYLLRIDTNTGRSVWRVERPTAAIRESPDAYTTPAIVKANGRTDLVITGADCVTGHDPATGRELWRANGLNPTNDPWYRIVASPVVVGDLVLAPTRVKPMLAIRAGGRGDVTESHRVWSFDTGPDVPTPVANDTHVFIVTDNGVMYSLDARTGATVWGPERIKPGTYSASPVLADGKIFATSEDGVTTIVRAAPTFDTVGENSLEDYTLSSPAVSQGQIFIRTAQHLWAIGQRRGAGRNP